MFHRDDRPRLSSVSALLVLVVVPTLLSACTRSQHPVLYPNAKLKQVGQGQADQDIDDCRKLAGQYVESTAAKEIGKGAAVGGVTGGAVGATCGAVHGAVTGHGAGTGAAVGAATGAAVGATAGVVR